MSLGGQLARWVLRSSTALLCRRGWAPAMLLARGSGVLLLLGPRTVMHRPASPEAAMLAHRIKGCMRYLLS